MLNLFKGKLTYTLALLAVLFGIGGWVTGLLEAELATGVIWAGLTAFGLRRAV